MARTSRILIVEDDEPLRRMIRQALTFAGYEAQEAGDGLNALRIIDSNQPDAVVLDLGLPILSGQTVLAEIAAHAHTREIPVIIITATLGDHQGLGGVCVLKKPFEVDQLIQTIRACLASREGPFSVSS